MMFHFNIISNWYFFLAILVNPTFSFIQSSHATDTLEFGQSITDGQKLVSAGEKFALGFFSPGNSTNRYVGIWFYKVPDQTVVWVANRQNPIANKDSGVLIITKDGDFMITDSNRGSSYILANGSFLKTPSAKLLDTGNLVLTETNPDDPDRNQGKILWQSFDYPTDSLLPYMTLVYNKTTKQNLVLPSWRSGDDPAIGDYVFGLDPNETISIWKRGVSYWRSRARNGEIFASAPDMASTFILNFSYISDENGVSFGYTTNNDSVITRHVMSTSGHWRTFSWSVSKQMWMIYMEQPRRGCNASLVCGAFGICNDDAFPPCECLEGFEEASPKDWSMGVWSGGCKRKNRLRCGGNMSSADDEGDGFLKLSKLGFKEDLLQPFRNVSQQECKAACLRNCTCSAYAYERGCYIWEGDLFNLQQLQAGVNSGRDVYIRVGPERKDATTLPDPSTVKGGRRNKRLLWILIGLIIPITSIILIRLFIYYLQRRKTKKEDELAGSWNRDPGLHLFSFAQITAATNNFSSTNKLGQGGYGPVYKGKLPEGEEIAVKRLSKCSGQGVEEFMNEVTVIAKVQHMNLVRLLGCCTERDEKMLIYEYMPNKCLNSFLFDHSKKQQLDWMKRIQIINGIAQGLLYLHTYSRLRIIHRDLKASNILLDGEMNSKISDFGMARIIDRDESKANTIRVVGTYGYMSPEYAMEGLFSVKSDVYSFGVLLLEILSGNKNSNFYHFDRSLNLLGYAWELWKEGNIIELMDPSLGESSLLPELTRHFHVALLCVQESPSDRPSMLDVVSMLKNEVKSLPMVMKPAFLNRLTTIERQCERSKREDISTNGVSISSLVAR